MRRVFALLALFAVIAAMLAFGPQSGMIRVFSATEEAGNPPDKELFVYNWGDYIDESLLKEYEDKYGVKITYDNFATNEELFAKLQAGAVYDVVFPTDYMISRLISLNLIVKLDKDRLPNLSNIDPYNLDNWFDPGAEYCAPYMWGTTGIAYSTSLERIPDGWGAFFDPEQAKYYSEHGGINLLDDERELIGAALQYLGYTYNDTDPDHLAQARDTIIKILPYVRYLNSADYQDTLMIPGEVAITQTWDGSAAKVALATATDANPEGTWRYIIPKEGGVHYQDGMCIPASSPHKLTAEHFINFLLIPENAARTSNKTGYMSTNKASRQFLKPALVKFLPSEEVLKSLEWIRPLDEAAMTLYDQTWTEIRASQ
jgi:spermidine/putrescine-binding protein